MSRVTACFVLLLTIWALQSCVDAVEPEFEFREGLIYFDALVGTTPQTSYATVSKSVREFGVNKNTFVNGALLYFIRSETGERFQLVEDVDAQLYLPPADFTASPGETWQLSAVLPGGKTYQSLPETIPPPVAVAGYSVVYDPEMQFNAGLNKFVPGHRVSVEMQDPPSEDNYYYWRYRSFERLVYCRVCYNQTIFRNEQCITVRPDQAQALKNYYTYACEERCWQIRYSDKVNIYSDEFSDGKLVQDLPVSEILLHTKRNLLVEMQQYSLTSQAYEYFKTLKDIIDNNSGFNSPLPAALVGNIYNPDDSDEFVLGRLTAASTTVSNIFIERIFVEEPQLEAQVNGQAEGLEAPPPIVSTAPCIESRYRTSLQPEAWQD